MAEAPAVSTCAAPAMADARTCTNPPIDSTLLEQLGFSASPLSEPPVVVDLSKFVQPGRAVNLWDNADLPFCMLRGHPCRLSLLRASKTGKHGHAKMSIEGKCVLCTKKIDYIDRFAKLPGYPRDTPVSALTHAHQYRHYSLTYCGCKASANVIATNRQILEAAARRVLVESAREEEVVQELRGLLAEGDADANAQDCQGNTALMYACAANKPDRVALLLQAKADPCREAPFHRTRGVVPAQLDARWLSCRSMQSLSTGLTVRTPLLYAANAYTSALQDRVVDKLAEYGADMMHIVDSMVWEVSLWQQENGTGCRSKQPDAGGGGPAGGNVSLAYLLSRVMLRLSPGLRRRVVVAVNARGEAIRRTVLTFLPDVLTQLCCDYSGHVDLQSTEFLLGCDHVLQSARQGLLAPQERNSGLDQILQ